MSVSMVSFRTTPFFECLNLVVLSFSLCKWVYKVKTQSNGSLERLSDSRLFSREETFAPVAKMTIVRTLISVVVVHQWPLYQLDVKNAFLNGSLSEEVYMHPPPRLSPPAPGLICRLHCALYGLKQFPRA